MENKTESQGIQFFENNLEHEKALHEATLKKRYLPNSLAIIGGLVFLWLTIGLTMYFNLLNSQLTSQRDKSFWAIKELRSKEVNSDVKKIIEDVGSNSSLVYNMSLFHVSPRTILEEAEKAIYIWQDKVITNESIAFTDYNTVTFWLITTDLENYAVLIKKLKKLYSDTFEIKWLNNFSVEYEVDAEGNKTGKAFYKTDIQLVYKKDPGSNLAKLGWTTDSQVTDKLKELYTNNLNVFDTFKSLIETLAEQRKASWKTDLYVTKDTKDESMFLNTDTEYLNRNIYYITQDESLTDLFSLNKVGTLEDYKKLKKDSFKILLSTSKDGQKYAICAKVPKQENELTELEKEDKNTLYTKVLSAGTDEAYIKWISAMCELL